MLNRLVHIQSINSTNHLVDRAKTEFCHDLSRFFGDHEQIVDHVFRFAFEFLTQLFILRRDPNGASVQMALAHHDAAERNQRCGCETVFFGSEQGRDHDVATGFQLAICLQSNAAAKIVHYQRLMCIGDTQLPRHPGMFNAGQRRSTRTTAGA